MSGELFATFMVISALFGCVVGRVWISVLRRMEKRELQRWLEIRRAEDKWKEHYATNYPDVIDHRACRTLSDIRRARQQV